MKMNKKAQQIANPYTLITILILISMFTLLFVTFGRDIAGNPNNNINYDSRVYIYSHSGFQIDNATATDLQQEFYSSTIDSEGNLKDNALEFQFYREQSSSLRQRANDFFNIPTYFIGLFNLDLSDWTIVNNSWNIFAWLVIFFAIYKFLRAVL